MKQVENKKELYTLFAIYVIKPLVKILISFVTLFLLLFIISCEDQEIKESVNQDNEYLKFSKKYPNISSFVIDENSLLFFKNRYRLEKRVIDSVIRQNFTKKEYLDKRNLIYIILALEFIGSNLDEINLTTKIRDLKNRYRVDDLEYIYAFWITYQQKYRLSLDREKKITAFYKSINIYGISILKKYIDYSESFYPTLLAQKYNNHTYQKIMKSLIRSIKSINMQEESFFLKTISYDIQIAIENGNKKREIINYFREFAKKDFTIHFKTLGCNQKKAISLVIADNLDYKLDWLKYSPNTFYSIIDKIRELDNDRDIINLLGIYNYASFIYSNMHTNQQKEMFENLINLSTDNILFNLSLIYILGNNTDYFSAIINENNDMYKFNKYREILYVSRNGKTILNLFRDTEIDKFVQEIDDLVTTPYKNIHYLTGEEIVDLSIKVADYASYVTIVTGAGIGIQVVKILSKATIKGVVKQGLNKTTKKSLKFIKKQIKEYLKKEIKYSEDKSVNKTINGGVKIISSVEHTINISVKIYSYLYKVKDKKELCKL